MSRFNYNKTFEGWYEHRNIEINKEIVEQLF